MKICSGKVKHIKLFRSPLLLHKDFRLYQREGRKSTPHREAKNRLMNLSPEAAGVAAGEAGRQAGRQRLAGWWLAVRRSEGQTVGEDEALGWEPTRNKVLAAWEEVLLSPRY